MRTPVYLGLSLALLTLVSQIEAAPAAARTDLSMNEDRTPDGPLTAQQRKLVAKLSQVEVEAIDRELLANCSNNWRKVARIVGTTMGTLKSRFAGVPDVYYSQRIAKLVAAGSLESQGNLAYMRYSEVRLSTR